MEWKTRAERETEDPGPCGHHDEEREEGGGRHYPVRGNLRASPSFTFATATEADTMCHHSHFTGEQTEPRGGSDSPQPAARKWSGHSATLRTRGWSGLRSSSERQSPLGSGQLSLWAGSLVGWGLEVPAVREQVPWLYPQEAHSHALALPSISPGSRDDSPPSDGETEAPRAEWLARGLAAGRGNALCLAAFSPLPRVSLPRLTSLSRSAASRPLSSSRARCAAVRMPSLADLAFAPGEALPEAHSLLSAPQALLEDSPPSLPWKVGNLLYGYNLGTRKVAGPHGPALALTWPEPAPPRQLSRLLCNVTFGFPIVGGKYF